MPGRMEVGEADGEWSDASDSAVKSGSATDASKNDLDDISTRHSGKMSLSLSSSSLGKKDPVNSILDRIDAELAAMPAPQTQASTILSRISTTCKPRNSLPPLLPPASTHSYDWKVKSSIDKAGGEKESETRKISGSAEIYTDAALTDVPTDEEVAGHQATEDFLSDLDSVVAQQIDSRFKEIMLKKKVNQSPPGLKLKPCLSTASESPPSKPPPPPVPPKPLTTGYGTDNDSIRTEDFEQRFQSLIVMADGNTSGDSIRKPTRSKLRKQAKSAEGRGTSGVSGTGSGLGLASAKPPISGGSSLKDSSKTSATSSRVSFEDKSKENDQDGKDSGQSSPLHKGLNRVLHHTMKSLGETTAKEPVESSSGLASLPPTGRSRSVSPERLIIHHPRVDYNQQGRVVGYPLGRQQYQLPHPAPWPYSDPWGTQDGGGKALHYSTGSSRSTFDEVESLYLSKSSSDSFGQYKSQQRHGSAVSSSVGSGPQQSLSSSSSLPGGVGQSQSSQRFLGGRLLSRQSSTTSTSTSSGNLGDHLDRRSNSTSASGSVHEDGNMETLDPRQQFDLNEQNMMDKIFRRVLEWNNAQAAMGLGGGVTPGGVGMAGCRGGVPGGSQGLSPGHTAEAHYPPQIPLNAYSQVPQLQGYPPGNFAMPNFMPGGPYAQGVNHQGAPPSGRLPSSPGTAGSNPYTQPVPASGRRAPDPSGDKIRSPSSDITHVKRRRDLILPDEEEDFSFSRPYGRNSDSKSRAERNNSKNSSSTGGVSSFSSKQASSESMLSSMSSMSQSQDQSWRDQFYRGFREMQYAASVRSQPNPNYEDPYAYPWRAPDTNQPVLRDHPHPMMMSGYRLPNPMLSRGISMDSMNSFGIPTPPESYMHPCMPNNQAQNPAERALMNLGFGGSAEGFLPERFLRDWYNKLSRTQGQYPVNPFCNMDSGNTSLYGSASNLHNSQEPKPSSGSKPNYEDLRSASDLHRRILQPMNRAATVSSAQTNDPPETPTSLLPPNMVNDSRSDRLKEYIEAYAQNMNSTNDARSLRIRQFANSRQKSLPSYLETLTEEDETKSRSSGYKPLQARESRLQVFLREDSLETKSDSQCTTSSNGTNTEYSSACGSESDSFSGSDKNFYNHRVRQVARTSSHESPVRFTSVPDPVTSRTLTLKMPGTSDASGDQSKTGFPDGAEIPGTPKKGRHRQGRRSRDSSPAKQRHSHRKDDCDAGSGDDSPPHWHAESDRKHGAKSPNRKAKSPKHRPRSPRHQRAKSPANLSTNSIHALAPNDNQWDEDAHSTNCNSSRNTLCTIDRGKLFVSNIPLGSPIRRRCSIIAEESTNDESSAGEEQRFGGAEVRNVSVSPPRNQHLDDGLVSTESLEVADIFQSSSGANFNKGILSNGAVTTGQLEPAMISIVLEDVDGNEGCREGSDGLLHQNQLLHLEELGHGDDLLHIPSGLSSLSPIPQSPVTVIEANQLDNQQDSIDTEEGTSSSRDHVDPDPSSLDSDALTHNHDFFSDDTDPHDFPFPEDGLYDERLATLSSSSSSNRHLHDAYAEADDGSISPIAKFEVISPGSSGSSSSPDRWSSNISDTGMQADDGRLTPLMLLNQEDVLTIVIENDHEDELYLVTDQEVQCDIRDSVESTPTYLEMAHRFTQTNRVVRYEMSSQTESPFQTPRQLTPFAVPSKIASPTQDVPVDMSIENFLSTLEIEDAVKTLAVLTNAGSRQASPLSDVSANQLTFSRKSSPETSDASFDNEFWDWLGMRKPLSLVRQPPPPQRKQQGIPIAPCRGNKVTQSAKTLSTNPMRNTLSIRVEDSDIESSRCVISDNYESVRFLPVDALRSSGGDVSSGSSIPSRLKVPRLPNRRARAMSSRPARSSVESLHSAESLARQRRYCYSSESSVDYPELQNLAKLGDIPLRRFSEHKAINTSITMALDTKKETEGEDSQSAPSLSHCSYTIPLKLDQPNCDTNNGSQVHVSQLNFKVNDYRVIDIGVPEVTCATQTTEADLNKCYFENNTSTPKRLYMDENERSYHLHAQDNTTERPTSPKLPEVKHNEPSQCESSLEIHFDFSEKSAPIEQHARRGSIRSLKADTHPLDDQKPTSDPNMLEVYKGKSIDDLSDSDFDNPQEAREFVLHNFVLKTSVDTNEKSRKTSVKTVVDIRDKRGRIESSTVVDDKPELTESERKVNEARAKVIQMFKLRETSTKPATSTSEAEKVKGGRQFRKSKSFNDKDAMRTLARDCHLVQTRLQNEFYQPCITEDENDSFSEGSPSKESDAFYDPAVKESDQKKSSMSTESQYSSLNGRINEIGTAVVKDGVAIGQPTIVGRSEKQNMSPTDNEEVITLQQEQDAKTKRLIELFSYSVIEAACHELQKSYTENKSHLQERIRDNLKLSGALPTKEVATLESALDGNNVETNSIETPCRELHKTYNENKTHLQESIKKDLKLTNTQLTEDIPAQEPTAEKDNVEPNSIETPGRELQNTYTENRSHLQDRVRADLELTDTQLTEDIPVQGDLKLTGMQPTKEVAKQESALQGDNLETNITAASCRELQKSYTENKSHLQERIREDLKLTGVLPTKDVAKLDSALQRDNSETNIIKTPSRELQKTYTENKSQLQERIREDLRLTGALPTKEVAKQESALGKDNFETNIIETPCRELQKTYGENKSQLQEHIREDLRLTGVLPTKEVAKQESALGKDNVETNVIETPCRELQKTFDENKSQLQERVREDLKLTDTQLTEDIPAHESAVEKDNVETNITETPGRELQKTYTENKLQLQERLREDLKLTGMQPTKEITKKDSTAEIDNVETNSIETSCRELQKTYTENKLQLQERLKEDLKLTGMQPTKEVAKQESELNVETSSLEIPCRELQTTYTENKSHLQERIREDLKLTGVPPTREDAKQEPQADGGNPDVLSSTPSVHIPMSDDVQSKTNDPTQNTVDDVDVSHENDSLENIAIENSVDYLPFSQTGVDTASIGLLDKEVRNDYSQSIMFESEIYVRKETGDVPTTSQSAPCSDAEDILLDVGPETIDSTASDGSSELSVIFAGSRAVAKEAHADTSTYYNICEDLPLTSHIDPVERDDETSVVLANESFAPQSVFEEYEYIRRPSLRKSNSQDSLDSIQVNFSASIEDILDVFESMDRADSINDSYNQGSSSEEKSDVLEEESAKTASTVNVSASNAEKHTEYIDTTDCVLPARDESPQGMLEETNPCMSRNQIPSLSREDNPSLESSDAPSDGVGSTSSDMDDDPITDAMLTELILLGVNHPDLKRFRDRGLFLDSFDSSPNFTTPENEVTSECEDQDPRGGNKSGDFGLNSVLDLDGNFFPGVYMGRRFSGYLSNITEEEGSFDKPEQSVAKETSDVVAGQDHNIEIDNNVSEPQSQQLSSSGFPGERSNISMEVSIEPLPADFSPGQVRIEYMPEPSTAREVSIIEDTSLDTLETGRHSSIEDNSVSDTLSLRRQSMFEDNSVSETSATRRHSMFEYVSMLEPTATRRHSIFEDKSNPDAVFVFDVEHIKEMTTESETQAVLDFIHNDVSSDIGVHYSENIRSKSPILFVTAEHDNSYTHNAEEGERPFDSSEEYVNHLMKKHHISAEPELDYTEERFGSEIITSGTYQNRVHTIQRDDEEDYYYRSTGEASPTQASPEGGISARRNLIRSDLRLSLHPMQGEADIGERPRTPLSAAERREAYNRLCADRTEMGLSGSFSEENLSSPPLRPRRFQRSMSKDSTSSELSPKRVKRAVSRGSPNFDTGLSGFSNSLHVPTMGESLATKTSLSRRCRSPPGSNRSLLPRSQSPIPDSNAPPRSPSPDLSHHDTSLTPGYAYAETVLSRRCLSPVSRSAAVSRSPSPVPDVTISSVNESVELVSFLSSPDTSPKTMSPSAIDDSPRAGHQQFGPSINVISGPGQLYSQQPTRSESPRLEAAGPSFRARVRDEFLDSDYEGKTTLPLLPRFRPLQKFDSMSSNEGSSAAPPPFTVKTQNCNSDNISGPLQFSLSRTFYSSTHIPAPRPRGRLRSFGEMTSNSSTESPMPVTPPRSRCPSLSSSSDSSPSTKDAHTTSTLSNHMSVSPSSSAGNSPNANDKQHILHSSPTAEGKLVDEGVKVRDVRDNIIQKEAKPATDTSHSNKDETVPEESPIADALQSNPISALHLRRSRFQKPENSVSMQQTSSSSDQSSSETSVSPRRRFFWCTGQRTVVSPVEEHRSPTEGSAAQPWKIGDHEWTNPPHPESDYEFASRPQAHPWTLENPRKGFHDSGSTAYDHRSSDPSVALRTSAFGPVNAARASAYREGDVSGGKFDGNRVQDVSSVNGASDKPGARRVRELAKHFEDKLSS